jgi:hypothetical protein
LQWLFKQVPAEWDWELVKYDKESDTKAPVLAGYIFQDKVEFAAEHIFEIQQLQNFIEKGLKDFINAASFKALFLCGKEGKKTTADTQPVSTKPNSPFFYVNGPSNQFYKPHDQRRSPIEMLLAELPRDDSDFVYLETDLNALKGVYFKEGKPNLPATIKTDEERDKAMRVVAQTHLVADYLGNTHVSGLYRKISDRIRDMFVRLVEDCEAPHGFSSAAKAFALEVKKSGKSGAAIYQDWEEQFIKRVEDNMKSTVDDALDRLVTYLEEPPSQAAQSNTKSKRQAEKQKTEQDAKDKASKKRVALNAALLAKVKSHQAGGGDFRKIDLKKLLQKGEATAQDLSVEDIKAAIDQAGDLSVVEEVAEDDDGLEDDLRRYDEGVLSFHFRQEKDDDDDIEAGGDADTAFSIEHGEEDSFRQGLKEKPTE